MANRTKSADGMARLTALPDMAASSVCMIKLDRPISGLFLKRNLTLVLVHDGIGPAIKLSADAAAELAAALLVNLAAVGAQVDPPLAQKETVGNA